MKRLVVPLKDAVTGKLPVAGGGEHSVTRQVKHGKEGTGNIREIVEMFRNELWKPDLILDAGVLPQSEPSTVLDLTTIKPKIVRVGPTKPERLMELLGI